MRETTAGDFETRACGLIACFLPLHEEHFLLPDDAPPSAVVAEVMFHVADAARTLAILAGAPLGGDEDELTTVLDAAVNFAWVAASALAAIPRVRSTFAASCQQKDELLEEIDRDAAGLMDADPDWGARSPDSWLRDVTGSLTGATIAVNAPQDWVYDKFALAQATDIDHADDSREELVDSLRDVALHSALAVQALESLHLADQA